jgi:tripartite-type tricarboxylate transporter receptor subunit TctC
LPPLSATIPNWNPPQWYNFLSVPAKTPADVQDKLDRAVTEVMKHPEIRAKLAESSFLAAPISQEELRAKLRAEYVAMGELLKAAQIQLS